MPGSGTGVPPGLGFHHSLARAVAWPRRCRRRRFGKVHGRGLLSIIGRGRALMVAVNGCPSYEPHLPMPPGIWGPVGVANKGGQAMSMERVGRVPCPEHHGQEFWGLAPELQRERGRTGAAKPSGHLIHWIVRSVKSGAPPGLAPEICTGRVPHPMSYPLCHPLQPETAPQISCCSAQSIQS